MKIFISYSTQDINLVQLFANSLSSFGEVKFWAKDKVLGNEAWETIFSWIDDADVVLVLVTGNTVFRAMSVGQEVGRAKSKNRIIIPIVEKSVPSAELGFLSGITYQQIDLYNPFPAMNSIAQTVQQLSAEKTRKQNVALTFAVIGFFLLLLTDK